MYVVQFLTEFNLLLSTARCTFMEKEKEHKRTNYLVPGKAHYLRSGWAGKPFTNIASHFFLCGKSEEINFSFCNFHFQLPKLGESWKWMRNR